LKAAANPNSGIAIRSFIDPRFSGDTKLAPINTICCIHAITSKTHSPSKVPNRNGRAMALDNCGSVHFLDEIAGPACGDDEVAAHVPQE
jgi:hypothetical protein